MRVGVFTPLLSQLSLEDVLKKLKSNQVDTVELGTGNYPGDSHCKLSSRDDPQSHRTGKRPDAFASRSIEGSALTLPHAGRRR